jgi:hypothetical protein
VPWPAVTVLGGGLVVVLAQVVIPIEQFVHRGDDAFYYFKIANNFPIHGVWTLDGVHSTTGVQPLFAVLLSALAVAAGWLGIQDPDTLARMYVAVTVLLNFGSAVLLYRLLIRHVLTLTAIVAAGTFLYSSSIVWIRSWGMENSLYAFVLLGTVTYFSSTFMQVRTEKAAVVLGFLLALTMFSRLNATILVPCILLYYLFNRREDPRTERIRLATIASLIVLAFFIPYIGFNMMVSGHPLPISGVAKSIATEEFLATNGIRSRLSPEFFRAAYQQASAPVNTFVKTRLTGPLWVVGHGAINPTRWRAWHLATLLGIVAVIAGRPRDLLRRTVDEFASMRSFVFLAIFGVLNILFSVMLYPTQLRYAMTSWWLVESEIVMVVIVSILVGTALDHVVRSRIPAHLRNKALIILFVGLFLVHGWSTYDRYWSDVIAHPTWNDEMYVAADWIDDNVAEGDVVGSWNAGILAYYTDTQVTNLDGLISDADLVSYIAEDRIADYILMEKIDYLSDLEPMFALFDLRKLTLLEVYSHTSRFGKEYKIFRVMTD